MSCSTKWYYVFTICVKYCMYLWTETFFFFYLLIYLFLLYNTALVLPYIDMNPPRVYLSSQSWIPFPPLSPYHLSGSSQCTGPKHPVSNQDWWSVSYMIVYMFQCHSPKSSHPLPLPQSPKVCSIHLCLFCCLSYRVIVAILSTHSNALHLSQGQGLSNESVLCIRWPKY